MWLAMYSVTADESWMRERKWWRWMKERKWWRAVFTQVSGTTQPRKQGHGESWRVAQLDTLRPALCFNIKTIFPGIGIPFMKIGWLWDCLIFMGIPIVVRWHIYIANNPTYKIVTDLLTTSPSTFFLKKFFIVELKFDCSSLLRECPFSWYWLWLHERNLIQYKKDLMLPVYKFSL